MLQKCCKNNDSKYASAVKPDLSILDSEDGGNVSSYNSSRISFGSEFKNSIHLEFGKFGKDFKVNPCIWILDNSFSDFIISR